MFVLRSARLLFPKKQGPICCSIFFASVTDEVREMGRGLGLPEERVRRHPFPGPGLAVRIIGAVDAQRVKLLQEADAIFIEEIRKAGLYDQIGQVGSLSSSPFHVLLPKV